jgi:hypothetical protein
MKLRLIVLAALVVLVRITRRPQGLRENPVRTDDEWEHLVLARQGEAYQLGAEHGRLVGEVAGQTRAFSAVEAQMRERGAVYYGEVTEEDIARARKGILH